MSTPGWPPRCYCGCTVHSHSHGIGECESCGCKTYREVPMQPAEPTITVAAHEAALVEARTQAARNEREKIAHWIESTAAAWTAGSDVEDGEFIPTGLARAIRALPAEWVRSGGPES